MESVFLTESAVLIELQSVRIVLLVLERVVVALLAFCASQCNLYSHDGTSRFTE